MEEVNATEAALLSGYSERTIRRKIASGVLPARRITGNRFAIRISDLPARHGHEALIQRVAVLEQRVLELEQQIQVLFTQVAAEGSTNEPQNVATSLRELLLQLGHETDRLDALFAPSPAGASPDWIPQQENKNHG